MSAIQNALSNAKTNMTHHHQETETIRADIESEASSGVPSPLRPDYPRDQYLTLDECSQYTSVPYDTLFFDHTSGLLRVERSDGIGPVVTRYVQPYYLVDYMVHFAPRKYRWRPQKVNLHEIDLISVQPRIQPHNRELITDIADHYRQGGATKPIWLLPKGDKYVCVDGYRRCCGAQAASLTHISAIAIPLPHIHCLAIATTANQLHGENLAASDLDTHVRRYLGEDRNRLTAFLQKKISVRAIARATGVSTATVCRVRARLQPRPTTEIDCAKMLQHFSDVISHADLKKQEDVELLAWLGHGVTAKLTKTLSSDRRQDLKRRLRLNAYPLCRHIPLEVRQLVDARGGNMGGLVQPQ